MWSQNGAASRHALVRFEGEFPVSIRPTANLFCFKCRYWQSGYETGQVFPADASAYSMEAIRRSGHTTAGIQRIGHTTACTHQKNATGGRQNLKELRSPLRRFCTSYTFRSISFKLWCGARHKKPRFASSLRPGQSGRNSRVCNRKRQARLRELYDMTVVWLALVHRIHVIHMI